MRIPPTILILIWSSWPSESLPLAPPPPDFSPHSAKSDLMAVVGEDELQSLRYNGFQDQLRHLREKTIGRDMKTPTEEMARVRNSIEDISEFSLDSTEIDEAINDITIPTDRNLKKSSKFTELAAIHNTDSSNKALPPFAFSEDEEGGGENEIEAAEKVETIRPSTVVITLPTSTTPTTTRLTTTTVSTTTLSPNRTVIDIDSDVGVPRRASTPLVDRSTVSSAPISIVTTTLPTVSFTRYSPPTTTTWFYPPRTQSSHIFSSSTVRLPSAIPLTGSPRASPLMMTTPRPHRAIYTTEFTIEPRRSEGKTNELRERIRSTSQLLNLLGDKIGGIDQRASRNNHNAPRTGVLTNIYDQGVVKRRNYRTKQWGRTGGSRRAETYDGQFTGVAYGATKQKGGGYTMRKKMAKRPWRGYKTKRLGERRPEGSRPVVEKRTTDVAIEPYGSMRRGEWIQGVKQSERRSAVRKVGVREKSFAQALFESEEASMRQLKKTLRQIRDVVKFKMSSTASAVSSTTVAPFSTSSTHPVTIKMVKKVKHLVALEEGRWRSIFWHSAK